MGKREVTVYTCDGCGAQSTVPRDTPAAGFKTIQLGATSTDSGQKLLCTICYGAVEWVAKFQRITHPPRAYRSGRTYSLRKDES